MKNQITQSSFFLLFFFALLLNSNMFGQGKIIKASEADALFGPVLKSEKINVQHLKMIMKNTPERVMFGFKNGRVHILDKGRKAQFPSVAAVENSDVFHVFSTDVLEQLLSLEKGTEVTVEERANSILSITTSSTGGDVYTLEFAYLCPPNCI
ncbi:MAG: hypothetical protein Q8N83_01675 [Ignavibacteria bacterium]|nr:hypothetical protein [Ignavibacteria bacterium]